MKNQSGLTLVEILGALVASSLILGTITFIMLHLHTGYDRITTKEATLQEARAVMNHIIQATRNETLIAEADSTYVLKLIAVDENQNPTGKSTNYAFDPGTNTVSVTYIENSGSTTMQLSDQVQLLDIQLSEGNRKIDIHLTVLHPDGTTHQSDTVIYVPKL